MTDEKKLSADEFVSYVISRASHHGFRLQELEFDAPNGMRMTWKSYWVDENAYIERDAE